MVVLFPSVLKELSRMRTPLGSPGNAAGLGTHQLARDITAGKSCSRIFRKQERILEKEREMHAKLHRLLER